ncbi:hypothetical protein EG68_11690 [Paragonimus skrjabini miyazakii]|uniref:Uncharacterized protein n=1 Tax=Paragonimus skrjabini miyazakii TaxID=59628 RepID=A0A8S9YDS6_9TREM|nr:hypothetical protein EG68_11690 [Paragonimus skrjabini miyazakii]
MLPHNELTYTEASLNTDKLKVLVNYVAVTLYGYIAEKTSSAFAIAMLGTSCTCSKTEGGLISICQDDVVHLWNIRQKNPELVHSLQFKRERLVCGHVPVGSGWLYLGTDKGNVHFVNVQRFATSGYVINWNKAIDM